MAKRTPVKTEEASSVVPPSEGVGVVAEVAKSPKKTTPKKKVTSRKKKEKHIIAMPKEETMAKKIAIVERISQKKSPKAVKEAPVKLTVSEKENIEPRFAVVRSRVGVVLLQPFRTPVEHTRFVSNVARYAGVAFVLVGGFFTLYNMSALTNDMAQSLTAQISGTTTCVPGTYCSDAPTDTSHVNTTPSVDIAVESSSNTLTSTVPVNVTVEGATRVDIIVVNKRTNVPTTLGTTVRVSNTVWRSYWQTASLTDDEYRVKAVVTNQYGTYTKEGGTTYVVLNHPVTEPPASTDGSGSGEGTSSGETSETNNGGVTGTTTLSNSVVPTTTEPALPTLTVTLGKSEPLAGTVRITTAVAGVTFVKHFIRMTGTAEYTMLGEATPDGEGKWRFEFDTKKVKNAEYDIRTQAITGAGLSNARTLTSLTIRNESADTPTTTVVTNASPLPPSTPSTTTTTNVEELVPKIDIELSVSGTLSRTVPVYARVREVTFVELYLTPERSLTPRFVGLGTLIEPGVWKFMLNTESIPNGSYALYAQAKNQYGVGVSKRIPVSIQNTVISPEPAPEVKTYIETVKEVGTEVKAIETRDVPEPVQVSISAVPPLPPIAPIVIKENNALEEELGDVYDDSLDELLTEFSTELTRIMRAFGKAKRENDLTKEQELLRELETTRDAILEKVPEGEGRDELLSKVRDHMNRVAQELRTRTEKSETIIRERVGESVRKDSDNDGVTDYDEVNVYNTDPLLADSDQDGYIDGAEILAGFNPKSSESEANVAFESPKDLGVVRDDILVVEHITTVTPEEGGGEKPIAHIGGRALPNSFVTIYIFSTPIVVTVKADAEGNWSYLFDKELDDGTHEVYVGMTDNTGRIIAKSNPLPFVKTAEAFTPVGASESAVAVAPAAPSLIGDNTFLTIGSIAIVAIGLVLILLGLHVRPREETVPSPA